MAGRIVWAFAAAVLSVGLVGCGLFSGHEEKGEHHAVAYSALPSAAQAAVARLTAGGTIKKVDCEREHGQVAYGVEASVGGKDVEYTVDSSGRLLGTETETTGNSSGQEDLQESAGDHGAQQDEGHEGNHEEGEDNK